MEALAGEKERAQDQGQDPNGVRLDSGPLGAGFGADKIEEEAYAEDARDLARRLPEVIPRAGPRQNDVECVAFVTEATGFF